MGSKKKVQRQERRARLGTAGAEPKQSTGSTTAPRTPLAVRARGVELDASLRAYIDKRVGFKLARFALSLSRVVVRLERPSGPKGGPEHVCRFAIDTATGDKVVVEAKEQDARAAFDAANDAAERAVRRLLERRVTKKVRGGPSGTIRRADR